MRAVEARNPSDGEDLEEGRWDTTLTSTGAVPFASGGYDYTQPGAYFITIIAHQRRCVFGAVVDGEMWLNDAGRIAEQCWQEIPAHFPHVELHACVVMPNHVHGIIWITGNGAVGARHAMPLPESAVMEQFGKPVSGSIPTIVRSFKSATTKRINEMRGTPGAPLWQRNYYEHIIRNDNSLNRLRQYIITNPVRWAMDTQNPNRTARDER